MNKLTSNPTLLIDRIQEGDDSRSFILHRQDFKLKTALNLDEGTSIYNNTYRVVRTVPKSKNLFAVVVSYYHHAGQIIIGNITKEIIMSEGQTPSQSDIYRIDDTVPGFGSEGSIWTGAVHRHNDSLMAGNMHIMERHPTLTKEVVTNLKTKDMRVLREAQAFSVVTQPLNTATPYLSALTLSRNLQGNVHGMFSFDHLTFAQESTNFGRSIQSSITLLSAASIEDIIIYQRVVKEDSAGNSLTPGRPSRCAIGEVSTFTRVASLNNGLRIVNGFNNNKILNIAFLDETTQDLESNMLEYKVEFLLGDQTKEVMSLVTDRLSSALTNWETAQDSQSPEQLKALVDSYISSVAFLLGDSVFATRSASSWQQNLLALISGSQEDQLRVVELIRNFSVGVNEAMSPTRNISSGVGNFHSTIYRSDVDRTARLTRIFAEKLRISYPKSVGFEYVDASILNPSTPIPSISYANMDARALVEVQKYAINNPNAGSINQYGFLTPVSVHLRANPVAVPTTTMENSNANFMGIIRSTAQTNTVLSLEPANTTSTNMVQTLAQAGIGAQLNTTNIVQMANNTQTAAIDRIDSENYVPAGSGFATVNTPQESLVTGSTDSVAISNVASNRLAASPLLQSMVNQTVTGFSNVTGVSNQANIMGSIPLASAQQSAHIIANSDAMTNLVNFGSIVQVQYLAPYDGTLGVQPQNWTLLTPETYSSTITHGKSLLCRLVLMSETLNAPVIVSLQPLASLFILGPEPSAPVSNTPAQTFTNIRDRISISNREALTYMNSSVILYAKNIPTGRRYDREY